MKNRPIALLFVCGLMIFPLTHPVYGCQWFQWQGNNRVLSQDLAACSAAGAHASRYPNDPAGTDLFRECMRNNGWLCLDSPAGKNKAGGPSLSSETRAPIDNTSQIASKLGIIHVSIQNANLYDQPGLDESVVEKVDRSADLKALIETQLWVKVQSPSGKQGWIAKNWVLELEKK